MFTKEQIYKNKIKWCSKDLVGALIILLVMGILLLPSILQSIKSERMIDQYFTNK